MKIKSILFLLVVLFLTLFSTYKLMNARTFQLFGNLTDRVETEERIIALTFDDGPTENVPNLLSLLDQYDAKATFFLIGKEIENNEKITENIVDAGHQIGNHTYSHERMIFKSPSTIKVEVEKTDALIRQAGFKGEIDFRPPNGKKLVLLPYYLMQSNRDTIMWDLEPDSYYTNSEDKVSYVNENVQNGSIILMHPMYGNAEKDLEAIEGILKSLTEQGYRFVTVNELQREEAGT